MAQLVVSLKRRVVFTTWNSNAARKMGKVMANNGKYIQRHVS